MDERVFRYASRSGSGYIEHGVGSTKMHRNKMAVTI